LCHDSILHLITCLLNSLPLNHVISASFLIWIHLNLLELFLRSIFLFWLQLIPVILSDSALIKFVVTLRAPIRMKSALVLHLFYFLSVFSHSNSLTVRTYHDGHSSKSSVSQQEAISNLEIDLESTLMDMGDHCHLDSTIESPTIMFLMIESVHRRAVQLFHYFTMKRKGQ
jgi:hypothetical protein